MLIHDLTRYSYSLALAADLHLDAPRELGDMLRITTESKRSKTVLTVEGRLAGQWVAALEQCWRELYAAAPRQKFSVNLCAVSFIDNAGKALLKEMHRCGGELIAEGCLNQAIVKEIVSLQEEKKSQNGKEPQRRKGCSIIFYVLFLSLRFGPAGVFAENTADFPVPPRPPEAYMG